MATIQSSLKILLKDLSCFDDSFINGIFLHQAKFDTVWSELATTKDGEATHEDLRKIREELEELSAKLMRKRHQNSRHIEAQIEKTLKKCEQSTESTTAYPERFSRMLRQHCVKFGNKAEEHAENVSAMCTKMLTFDPKKASMAAPLSTPPPESQTPDVAVADSPSFSLPSFVTITPTAKEHGERQKKKSSKQNNSSLNLSMLSSVTVTTRTNTEPMSTPRTAPIFLFPQRTQSTDDFFACPRQLSKSGFVSATPSSNFVRSGPALFHLAKTIVCPSSGRWRHNPYMC